MSENVIESSDVTKKKTPKSFRELNKEQLVEAAKFYGADHEGNNDAIRASLVENGVEWSAYAEQFLGAQKEPELETVRDTFESEVTEVTTPSSIATAEENITLPIQDKYLVKMIRNNPYFEYGRFKFTQEKPYAIMDAQSAEDILNSEDGFRQAFPSELQEFYS